MRLSEIVGHRAVRDALVTAHQRGKAHHAYLFSGPEGVGKRAAAYGFAALINCVGDVPERGATACGVCRHCRRIFAMAVDPEASPHPDVVALVPDGKQIKIAQVRTMLRVVPFPPIEAAYRIVIVDPADAMGDEAANALLKTLEEPPSRTRFVLITGHAPALLTTIRSRCQRVRFGRLSDDELREALTTRLGVERAAADRVLPLADGSPGAAMALLDDPIMSARDAIVGRVLGLAPGDVVGAFALAAKFADAGGGRATIFELLERLYRDALMIRVGAGTSLFFEDLRTDITAWARRYSAGAIEHRLEVLAEVRLGMQIYHVNPRIALERLCLVLAAAPGREGARITLPELQ